jgi:hypothetical protein
MHPDFGILKELFTPLVLLISRGECKVTSANVQSQHQVQAQKPGKDAARPKQSDRFHLQGHHPQERESQRWRAQEELEQSAPRCGLALR